MMMMRLLWLLGFYCFFCMEKTTSLLSYSFVLQPQSKQQSLRRRQQGQAQLQRLLTTNDDNDKSSNGQHLVAGVVQDDSFHLDNNNNNQQQWKQLDPNAKFNCFTATTTTAMGGTTTTTTTNRREWLLKTSSWTTALVLSATSTMFWTTTKEAAAAAVAALAASDNNNDDNDNENMFAPKFVQEYPDFIRTPQGWSYRDVMVPQTNAASNKRSAQLGDRVVFDWSGYTIGYFGRPFQAKGGPQGGAFEQQDVDYERTVLGSGRMIVGLEQALLGMTAGSVRQVLIPYGPLSYPPTKDGDADHRLVGPTPTTFSGQRALNFVLDNPRIDRTLLFNVKVIRVDSPNNARSGGGFTRGGR